MSQESVSRNFGFSIIRIRSKSAVNAPEVTSHL